jgi:two-component system osmolarity sensor histidine kinase EnvZ
MPDSKAPLNLFWRSFALLALLLAGGIFAWVLALQKLETEPRVALAAQQIASLVNLSREALRYTDRINRVALVKAMSTSEAIRLMPREPGDRWQPFEEDRFTQGVGSELRARLGADTIAARSVNGVPGLWVGFSIEKDPWWLRAEAARIHPLRGSTWIVWLGIALLATSIGAVAIARLMQRPLRELSSAAGRIRAGEFESRLDETAVTSEIRDVNRGFNRMARELAKVDKDRAVMLAGISHDLRTPLARLRLEAEMSVSDVDARANMASDIVQLDTIIGKFMDYARPGEATLRPVLLAPLVEREVLALRHPEQIRIDVRLPADLQVLVDEVELGRVFANLFENARRYGRSADTGIARVQVSCVVSGPDVICTVRDHGSGVPAEQLSQLTTPFFRGDAARTAATGTGLGLAIVEKTLQRMGGSLTLANVTNAADGGLVLHLRLKTAG